MSGEEGESRSDRLRRRRSQRQENGEDEASESTGMYGTDETDRTSSTPETDKPSKPSKQSVKDEQTPVYMYLPESQKQEIERLYNILKAEYEYEHNEDFEKNRHFYPLLVQYGLDNLDGLDAFEIQDYLDKLV